MCEANGRRRTMTRTGPLDFEKPGRGGGQESGIYKVGTHRARPAFLSVAPLPATLRVYDSDEGWHTTAAARTS